MPYYNNRRTPKAPDQGVFPFRKGDILISLVDYYHFSGVCIDSGTGGRCEWGGVTRDGAGDPKVKVTLVYDDGHLGPEAWYNVSDVRHASVDEAAFISDVLSRKITHAEIEAERQQREDDPMQLADTEIGRQIVMAAPRDAGMVTFRATVAPAFTEPKATTAPPPPRTTPVVSVPPTTRTPRTRPAPAPRPDGRPGAPRGGVPSLEDAASELLTMLGE